MNGIGRKFGSGEGVPRKADALAALGVDVKGDKGSKGLDREREGAKGLDDIRLSAAERAEVEKPQHWDRELVIEWLEIMTDQPWRTDPKLLDRLFKFLPDGGILVRNGSLDLSDQDIKELPPYLHVDQLFISGTKVKELPYGLDVKKHLALARTEIAELPEGITCNTLELSSSLVKVLPPSTRVKTLFLYWTDITEIPPEMAETLERIHVKEEQVELIESAKRLDIQVIAI